MLARSKSLVVALVLLFGFSLQAQAFQQGEKVPAQLMADMKIDPEKVTIVDFFASWCVSCRVEIPLVSKFQRSVDGNIVDVVGVDVDEDIDMGARFQKYLKDRNGLSFRVIDDPQQKTIEFFKPDALPALYYLYQGQVLKVRIGAIEHIDQVIVKDLKQMGLQL